jgi:hypothetical protein
MLTLDAGNVLLKPSHRRQLMSWLRRSLKLGQRIGDFALTLSMRRCGRQTEVWAKVTDRVGNFHCHARQSDWRYAVRDVIRSLSIRLADHRDGRALA